MKFEFTGNSIILFFCCFCIKRSLEWYWLKNSIRQRLTTTSDKLREEVASVVQQVFVSRDLLLTFSRLWMHTWNSRCLLLLFQLGSSYGLRSVRGHLRSKGITASEKRIRGALNATGSAAVVRRSQSAGELLNPKPYTSNGFGDKCHVDQNEKLIHVG